MVSRLFSQIFSSEFNSFSWPVLLWVRLQTQESMLAQSQKYVQELTSELRNRCLELKDLSHRIQNEEKLVQVRNRYSSSLRKNVICFLKKLLNTTTLTDNLMEPSTISKHIIQRYILTLPYNFMSGCIFIFCRKSRFSVSRMFSSPKKTENLWDTRTTNRGLNIW